MRRDYNASTQDADFLPFDGIAGFGTAFEIEVDFPQCPRLTTDGVSAANAATEGRGLPILPDQLCEALWRMLANSSVPH